MGHASGLPETKGDLTFVWTCVKVGFRELILSSCIAARVFNRTSEEQAIAAVCGGPLYVWK
jgi:hypothetical protein